MMSAPARRSYRLQYFLLFLLILLGIILPFILFGSQIEDAALSWSATSAPGGLVIAVIGLLALDVLLPVPSSIVSLIAGQSLGAAKGALVIWVGMTMGCYVGMLVGRGLLGPVARILRVEVPARTDGSTLQRWGWASLWLMRPIPVLAEASVLFAAACGVSMARVMTVTSLANIPIACLYGYFGAWLLGEVPLWVMLAVLAVLSAPMALWQRIKRP